MSSESGVTLLGDTERAALPEWISQVLARWVPPDDYDARMAGVVDSYVADRLAASIPRPDPELRQPA